MFLNGVYLLSGSAGLNVPMFTIELSMVLVGAQAGMIGLDAVVVPYLTRQVAARGRRRRPLCLTRAWRGAVSDHQTGNGAALCAGSSLSTPTAIKVLRI